MNKKKEHECIVAVLLHYRDRKYFHTWSQVKRFVKEERACEGYVDSDEYAFLDVCPKCHKELQVIQNRWKYEALI